jgi:hypothetical protein
VEDAGQYGVLTLADGTGETVVSERGIIGGFIPA